MSNLGMGAMLHLLGGGSAHSSYEYKGLKITSAKIEDDRLCIEFEGGKKIQIWDDGQSCCESRYMTCDDDPSVLVGGEWVHAMTKEAPDIPDGEYEYVHEQVFVEVQSTAGFITLCSHNEHNGNYGGFFLTITEDNGHH